MLVTAVHPILRKVNINSLILQSLNSVNNTQLDVTVTYNVTILVNQVNTYQWLTTDSLTGSSSTLDGLTVSCYRTWSEYTFLNLLDVSRLRSLVYTYSVVNLLELVVQTEGSQHLVRHYLIPYACAILSKAEVVVVSLNEWLEVNLVVVSNSVSSWHRNSTCAVIVVATIVTSALIEVVSTNLTPTIYSIIIVVVSNECTLIQNLIRSIVSQSNNVNESRNNYSVVRSNGSVVQLKLSSQEWQRSLRRIIIYNRASIFIFFELTSTVSRCIITSHQLIKIPPVRI